MSSRHARPLHALHEHVLDRRGHGCELHVEALDVSPQVVLREVVIVDDVQAVAEAVAFQAKLAGERPLGTDGVESKLLSSLCAHAQLASLVGDRRISAPVPVKRFSPPPWKISCAELPN